ncbi:MAG: 50S ribosomal protein L6 [Clostridia bacterium]|nr:50S ribosomal protein L6 [Clostridia bacterium]MCI9275088.1 50S ribosomal protein L6 [Clostridia bacterium]
MSRIGNNPIEIPEGVEINVQGSHVSVKGPKGTLERDINENLIVTIEDKKVTVKRPNDETEMKSLHGLTRTLIANMIIGVKEEFTKELQVNGVGYRVQKQGNDLNLVLGYSHNIVYKAPQGISFDVPNPNTIIVKGIDKELVGQTAAEIRTKRLPEVYGGKGIKYSYEVIRRKEGKTGKK